MDNTTVPLPMDDRFTTTDIVIGYVACLVSCIGFGTMFVPLRNADCRDGQWRSGHQKFYSVDFHFHVMLEMSGSLDTFKIERVWLNETLNYKRIRLNSILTVRILRSMGTVCCCVYRRILHQYRTRIPRLQLYRSDRRSTVCDRYGCILTDLSEIPLRKRLLGSDHRRNRSWIGNAHLGDNSSRSFYWFSLFIINWRSWLDGVWLDLVSSIFSLLLPLFIMCSITSEWLSLLSGIFLVSHLSLRETYIQRNSLRFRSSSWRRESGGYSEGRQWDNSRNGGGDLWSLTCLWSFDISLFRSIRRKWRRKALRLFNRWRMLLSRKFR